MLSNKDKMSYLVQIVNGIIPLLIISLFVRDNGLSFIGDYFLALSIIGATQVAVDYGFNISGVRSFATLLERRAADDDIWSLLLSIVAAKSLIAALLVVGVMVYVIIAAPANALYVISGVAAGVVLSVTNAAPLVFALKQSIRLSLATLVARVVFMLPLFVFEPSLLVALTVTMLPILIANIYSFIVVRGCIDVKVLDVKIKLDVLGQFTAGRSIFFNTILASLITTAWPLLLSNFLTLAELGAYGIADKIVRGLMTFVTPLPAFILASNHVIGIVASAGMVLRHRLYRIFLLIVLLAPVVLNFLPDAVFKLLLGNGVIEYRIVLNIYGVGFLFYFCDLILYTFMIVAKREALYAPMIAASFLLSFSAAHIFELHIYTPLIFEALVAFMLMLTTIRLYKGRVLTN